MKMNFDLNYEDLSRRSFASLTSSLFMHANTRFHFHNKGN